MHHLVNQLMWGPAPVDHEAGVFYGDKETVLKSFYMDNEQKLDFSKIEKEAARLERCQRKIIEQILDNGFDYKETNFSFGYIRGIQDLLNSIFNINRNRPMF